MSKRNKTYKEILTLIQEGKVTDVNRNQKAGISIHLFNEMANKLGYEVSFYLNKETKHGVKSINCYDVKGTNNGKPIVSPVSLACDGNQLRADINIYSLNAERREALLSEVDSRGFIYEHSGKSKDKGEDKGKCRIKCETLDNFFEVVDFVGSIDALVTKGSGGSRIATQLVSLEDADKNHFLSTASIYKVAVETKNQRLLNNFRTLLGADSVDHLITKGRSYEYDTLCDHDDVEKEKSRREHVVPCVRIHNRVIEMAQNGHSVEEIAKFIEDHMIIVMISDRERFQVDVTLGYRDSMPENWNWGDDVYERLTKAGIKWKMI